MSQGEKKLKSIFEYADYREFLKDYYDYSKATKRSFSYRLFARLCGFKSSNFLMLVMQGRSRLTSVSVEQVIKGVKFNKEEAEFFRNLVSFNEAKTSEQRTVAAKEMLRSRSFKKIHPLSEAQYHYLGTWYLPVIQSIVGLPGFKEDPQWIAENISPPIEPEQAEKALQELMALGLIQKNEQGKLVQTNTMLETPAEVTSVFAAQYHKQMLERAAESIDRFPRERRHLAGITAAFDSDAVAKVKELAEKFRNDVMEIASQSTSADSVYQVNLQTFPLFLNKEKKS